MVDVASLRKAELHCHVDGVVDPAMLDELARLGEPLSLDPAALRGCYPIRSIADWHRYTALVEAALVPKDRWLPRLVEFHVARLRAQRVTYAELFISGLLFARDAEAELVELFAQLRDRAHAAAGRDLEIALVVCIGRGPADRLARQLPRIRALRRAGLICGVALAGDEAGWPIEPFTAAFDELHDLGLGIEVHAGEFAGAESVRAALRCARPHRLGHAIAAFSDEALVAEIVERDIHVEFCPSSNLALGIVPSLAEHPIGRARDVAFSINTDDPGPFACSLTSELELAARSFGFDRADLDRIFANTMRAAFRGR